MAMIFDQRFGKGWASYNADCVFGMRNLPDNSIDFSVFSPPFLALYIYSDNIADLGNTDSEEQFFEGWKYHLEELYRVLKSGKQIAIHCKDTMRYMTSHDYAGLYDFPGHIIRLCEEVGFTYERWITVWKDPVIEMQRTKTYGLLHKSFEERGEVTRQGCADYVLVFNKGGKQKASNNLPSPNRQAIERCIQQWTNPGELIHTPLGFNVLNRQEALLLDRPVQFSFWSQDEYSGEFIQMLLDKTSIGRLATIHCSTDMLRDIVLKFEAYDGWKFHSRVALTDGSFLVTFRNWSGKPDNNIVKHSIMPPEVDYQKMEIVEHFTRIVDNEIEVIEEHKEVWEGPIIKGNENHPDYVGTQPPIGWRDRKYYSILLWQRYASPVWFDLAGLPESHPDCWMNIIQTNVLNAKGVRNDDEASKHICPLQLDLIQQLILEYTKPSEIVMTPYGGIGSECYQAVLLDRKAIGFELKTEYYKVAIRNLESAEIKVTQKKISIFA